MNKARIILFIPFILLACSTSRGLDTAEAPSSAKGDALRGPILTSDSVEEVNARDARVPPNLLDSSDLSTCADQTLEVLESTPEVAEEVIAEGVCDIQTPLDLYPPGPYSLKVFGIMPDMAFYNPWDKTWLRLSEYYKHPDHKLLLVVSSAGWCGPCQKKAVELVELYDEYHVDGFEVVYTMLQSFELLDWIFTSPDNEENDLYFMEQWKDLPLYYGGTKPIQYPLYGNPTQEFAKYFPAGSYGIPLSLLITTKDMGIRFMEQGFAPNVLKNKIMLNLYNDTPDLPLE